MRPHKATREPHEELEIRTQSHGIREPQRRRELIRHRRRNNPPIDQGIREDGDKPSDSTANRVSPESPKVRNNKRKKSKSVSLARQSPQRNSDEGAKMRRRRQKSRA
ncbi:hypothetical protein GW17_00060445 [Ensete ventricosum]|nr:hypothetical protein GW17_00060445 [Ensete ventricosum]